MLRLFTNDNQPDRIAVSKRDSFVGGDTFFLDFSRPLKKIRSIGIPVSLGVPVIHEGQQEGVFTVSAHRGEPAFTQVLALWNAHYPSSVPRATTVNNASTIAAQFGEQFPTDCR